MREVRFNRGVYSGEAVDRGVKLLGEFARFQLSEEEDYWVVQLECEDPGLERQVRGELLNFALGLTLESRDLEARDQPREAGGGR